MRKEKLAKLNLYAALLFIQSCCFSTKNTSLGSGISISEYSVKEVGIMYCNDPCCNSGTRVIPETLVAYDFDDNWIIAKTDSTYYSNPRDFAYWIFDKTKTLDKSDLTNSIKSSLIGPVDSTTFYKLLSQKSIALKLRDYGK